MRFYTVLIMMMTIVTTNTYASSYTRDEVRELETLCTDAQNEFLKKPKEKKIKTCMEVDKLEEEYCRRFFKDFGAGNNAPANIRNKLRSLPECVEAFNARKNMKR